MLFYIYICINVVHLNFDSMKALNDFAQKNGLKVEKINYSFQGLKIKRKGFDLVNKAGRIIASFEPVFYSNGDKYFLKTGEAKKRYCKRISKGFLNTLNVNFDSFIYLKK